MENIDDIQLGLVKFRANAEKYFSLFDKHIPRFENSGKDRKFLLLGICNESVMLKICALNPKAKYYIADQEILSETLPLLDKNLDFKFYDSNLELYDIIKGIDMKFDCIIMNPPYERNLHLKILAETIKHLKDEKSVCVNLSPILWIEDCHAHMKNKSNLFKFRTSIMSHIKQLDVIDKNNANTAFNISLFSNLGVYVCNKSECNVIDSNNFWKRNFSKFEIDLFEKIYSYTIHLSDKCENNKKDGIRVLIAFIAGNRGVLPIYKDLSYVIDGKKDGKDWTKCKNNGGYKKTEGIPLPCSIKFNSISEALNFYDSWKTTFLKFICKRYIFDQNIQLQFLPFMEDYTEPWTDERFYKFFNITEDEQKIIEDTMAKYK